jgi:hypothetical protein
MKIASTHKVYKRQLVRKAYVGTNVVWRPEMFCIDYTTFTEVDADSDITVFAKLIEVVSMKYNVSSHVVYDGGIGAYGTSFTHYTSCTFKSSVAPNGSGLTGVWGVSESVRSHMSDMYENFDGIVVAIASHTGLGLWAMCLYNMTDRSVVFSSYYDITLLPKTLYFKIIRDWEFITLEFYNDNQYSDLLGTLERELPDGEVLFRYLYGVISGNGDAASEDHQTLDVHCLDVGY